MTYTEKEISRSSVRKGFTIVEIAIVIGVIGLILAFLLPNIGRITGQAQRTATDSKLKSAQAAIAQFQLNTLRYPTKLTELVTKPADPKVAAKWRGPYIDDEPEDGWGNPLKYELTPGRPKPYNLYSWGPNGPGAPQDEWISVWDL